MKVFKNPNRGKSKHMAPEAYVPEYERLKKEPNIVTPSREEFRKQPTKIVVPPQVRVNSGQAVDGSWMQPPLPLPQVNQAQANTQIRRRFENSFYDEPLSSQAVPDFSKEKVETIDYDSINLPDEVESNVSEIVSAGIDFISIQIGEYILMYDNDIIASGSLDEITEVVEKILTSDDYNVDVEKVVVLKKMNLRTGVLISE